MNNDKLILPCLQNTFGFREFKGDQKQIINNIINKKDTFVIMPTGGGKSLCYQLPALISDGTAIVISPLIALMKNQVDAVRGLSEENSIAHVLNSSLSSEEVNMVKSDVKSKKTKLLYLAPESLAKASNIDFLKSIKISFLAIDEAHCISEWGHDFRPDYRNIRNILDKINGNLPIIALTATATPKVQSDILKNLQIVDAAVFKSSFNRANLYYEVRLKNEDINNDLIKFIKKNPEKSGIIYCLSRKKVEEISELLVINNIRSVPYHAGLESKVRNQNQDSFLMDDVDVVVATIAFGMGIDKPDIRFVIHYDVPKSLEGYYQETGRAGRDGGEGHCLAYYSYKDVEKLEKFLESKNKTEKDIASMHLDEVVAYCNTSISRRKYLLNYFGEYFDSESGEGRLMDDNMQNPKPKIDVKENLIKLLTIISETKGIYKQKDLVGILLGKNNALLTSHKIVDNKYFGSGKSKNEQFWNGLLWCLRAEGMVLKKVENFGSLAITEKGLKYLKNPKELLIPINENNSVTEKVHKTNISQSGDIVLMNKLKELRKKIADDKSIPPYVIFQDPSLNEMTFRYPISTDELSSIFGVGEGKAKKYGKDFIELIAKHVKENNIDRPDDMVVKSAGKNSSLKLFIIQGIDRKLSIDDIAQSKSMQVEELISEMETIVYSGTKLDLSYCIDDYLDEDQQDELYDYFIESESDDIELALTDFDGEYDEFELKLFRIRFLSDLGN
ncbi:MAG: ATP-dependent DNA helicase RecQ [Flavobacteriaceae bacterium]|nr:ATP-dependent DNA helicase RecQ [Flavobacteriaceae bacterium]OUV84908.1 MAG: ATP-dependent DNA helicase RecQ [Flavobacteriaceae bacterium TMED145]